MKLTTTRMDELASGAGPSVQETLALVRIARVRRCEAAECDAWRERRKVDGSNGSECWHSGRYIDATELAIKARAATDAARAEMEGR